MFDRKRTPVHTPLGTRYNRANLKKFYSKPWNRWRPDKRDKWFRIRNLKNRKIEEEC